MWYKSAPLTNLSPTMNPPNSSATLFAFDDLDTQLDAVPFGGDPCTSREESFVGALPRESTESVPEAVCSRHQALALAIADLESVCASFDSVDVSATAAQTSLRRRVGSLSMLCGALGDVAVLVERSELEVLFAGEGELAPYLAGIYLWAGDVTETLATLARDLNALAPNWSAFRERLDDVAWIYEMTLGEHSRVGRAAGAMPDDVRAVLGELFTALAGFKQKLDEPFG